MEQKDYRLAAIMYTDIVGFSRMMEKDEAGTLKLLRFHNRIVKNAAVKFSGTIIKTIGDAFLVDFRSTVSALQCAMEIQDKLYINNMKEGTEILLLRIGLHLGDIYFFENDALGDGINIASRLQSLARPGCICFSQDVYNQVINKIDFHAEKLGQVSLKNISKEIHAFEICSDNIEFNPDHNRPRTGFKITTNPKQEARPENDQSNDIIREIRSLILADIRKAEKRPTVSEMKARYGSMGPEALEVISRMADEGFIIKGPAPSGQSDFSSKISSSISNLVNDTLKAIETGVETFQNQKGQSARQTSQGRSLNDFRLESIAQFKKEMEERGVQFSGRNLSEKARLKAEFKKHEMEVGTGKWDKELRDSDYFKPGSEELADSFGIYAEKLEKRSIKTISGFWGHLISFLAVNSGLWFLNLMVSPGFLWALIVTTAWGIGISSNIVASLRARKKLDEIRKMPDLEGEALDTYKKLNRVRDSIARHFASALSTPILLFTINLLTSPGFLWAAIPSGIMILSFLSHLASYPMTKKNLVQKLFRAKGVNSWKELFALGRRRRSGNNIGGAYAHIYNEAMDIHDDIVRTIRGGTNTDDFGEDMIPSLDRYLEQVRLLTHSVNDIDKLVASIPMNELKKDREALELKAGNTENPMLKEEYRRSIHEIEKQEKACRDLGDQQEVLRLRLGSSVNALKQLKMDLGRLKAMPESSNEQLAIEEIRRKASDLTTYLDDLQLGYEESIRDPFEELEKLSIDNDSVNLLSAREAKDKDE